MDKLGPSASRPGIELKASGASRPALGSNTAEAASAAAGAVGWTELADVSLLPKGDLVNVRGWLRFSPAKRSLENGMQVGVMTLFAHEHGTSGEFFVRVMLLEATMVKYASASHQNA